MEELAKKITIYTSQGVEMLAALIIGMAVIRTLFSYLPVSISRSSISSFRGPVLKKIGKEEIRLQFGTSVAVALELLLGADVLATAVAPSWDDIGKLAAIAVIRTTLNFFLEKELRHVRTAE